MRDSSGSKLTALFSQGQWLCDRKQIFFKVAVLLKCDSVVVKRKQVFRIKVVLKQIPKQ